MMDEMKGWKNGFKILKYWKIIDENVASEWRMRIGLCVIFKIVNINEYIKESLTHK